MKTAIKIALLGWVAAGVAANTCNVQIGFSGAGKTTRCMCIARDGPFEKCEWSAELDDYICESVPTLNIGHGADPGTHGYSMAPLKGTPHTVIDTEGTEGSDINAASMPALSGVVGLAIASKGIFMSQPCLVFVWRISIQI